MSKKDSDSFRRQAQIASETMGIDSAMVDQKHMQISKAKALCLHCGISTANDASFCCSGCESVYTLLMERGLGHFYELKETLSFKPGIAATNFNKTRQSLPQGPLAQFYLEGIHCLGCLWLLEKLPEIDNRIRSATLDLNHQILELRITPAGISWEEVIQLIQQLGYKPHALGKREGVEAIQQDQRRQLIRIGVAGFCSGNIMLLAVSIYGGAEMFWSYKFAWISCLLAIPVLTYSAWPLYRGALLPLRKKQISVDLAIALALIAGSAMSLWSLSNGGKEIYFDSLSMLVFLLLSSRYLLSRFRENLAKEAPYLSYLLKEEYQRVLPKTDEVNADEIMIRDIYSMHYGQTVPVDSIISKEAYFDLSLLTGESSPVKFQTGDLIDAGAKLISEDLELTAVKEAKDSRLAQILSQVRSFQLKRSPSLDFADRMGRYFVFVVLSLALATLFFVPGEEGFRRALALIIVTCPCVLAFAVPLTLVRGMQSAARKGIFFRSPDRLEALAKAEKIFFDKTGTLTTGEFEVLHYKQIEGSEIETKLAIYSLEKKSFHPIAKAIIRNFFTKTPANVSDLIEVPGSGISGNIEGEKWTIEKSREHSKSDENKICVFKEGKLQAEIILGDKVRPEAIQVIQALKKNNLTLHLLSGDRKDSVESIAKKLCIKNWESELNPEEKANRIAEHESSIMVGDGANDSIAFQAASVGIAMQGSIDLSLKNADIALSKPGLHGLLESIHIAKRTLRLVNSNFRTTLLYNILAGILAISGYMSPLIAAVLMPASAFSVFAYTQWKTMENKI